MYSGPKKERKKNKKRERDGKYIENYETFIYVYNYQGAMLDVMF